MTQPMIDSFMGGFRFLSNFYPCEVDLDGETYPSTEHAYQAAKTMDLKERKWVQESESPNISKKRGQKVTLRPDWETFKFEVMLEVVRQKFQDPELKKQLLETVDAPLVEKNWWGDVVWGVCDGKGENHLGKILMLVRKEINDAIDIHDGNMICRF